MLARLLLPLPGLSITRLDYCCTLYAGLLAVRPELPGLRPTFCSLPYCPHTNSTTSLAICTTFSTRIHFSTNAANYIEYTITSLDWRLAPLARPRFCMPTFPSLLSAMGPRFIFIGVDFGGSPGTCPKLLKNAHVFITLYHLLPPNILVCPTNIFDKSTPLFVLASLWRSARFLEPILIHFSFILRWFI